MYETEAYSQRPSYWSIKMSDLSLILICHSSLHLFKKKHSLLRPLFILWLEMREKILQKQRHILPLFSQFLTCQKGIEDVMVWTLIATLYNAKDFKHTDLQVVWLNFEMKSLRMAQNCKHDAIKRQVIYTTPYKMLKSLLENTQ